MEARSSSSEASPAAPPARGLRALLPAAVAVAEARGDLSDAPLWPEEEAAVARAVARRRREFATGRVCARDALRRLGLAPCAIPAREGGAPVWPAEVIGSITHCEGYRAAAVARTADLAAIGIDAEPNGRLPGHVLERIALADERDRLAMLARENPSVSWDRLLFSAKESTYKALSQLGAGRLSFADAVVTFGPTTGTLSVRLLDPRPANGVPDRLAGRWQARDGLLLTAIALPPR